MHSARPKQQCTFAEQEKLLLVLGLTRAMGHASLITIVVCKDGGTKYDALGIAQPQGAHPLGDAGAPKVRLDVCAVFGRKS